MQKPGYRNEILEGEKPHGNFLSSNLRSVDIKNDIFTVVFLQNLFWVHSEQWNVEGKYRVKITKQEDAVVSNARWQFVQGQCWRKGQEVERHM